MKKRSLVSTVLCIMLLSLCAYPLGCRSAAPAATNSAQTPSPTAVPTPASSFSPDAKLLTISVIDVGQGDSILIQTPNGKTMLIDAGDTFAANSVTDFLAAKGVKKIDILVLTHPKQSHVGGMPAVIERYPIGSLYMPDCAMTNAEQSMRDFQAAVKNKNIPVITARAGVSIAPDDALTVEMLGPVGTGYETTNDYSAIIKITYLQNTFLFPGDATQTSEAELIKSGANLKADVLKIGHHGDATSSSEAFLRAVSPKIALISVGKDAYFILPQREVLDRIAAVGASIYRTDNDGSIIVTSDGQSIRVKRMGK